MKSDEFIPWATDPALWVAVLAMASLASFVALDMARRFVANPGRAGQAWLVGAALALGTGLWSSHFIGLSGDVLPFGIGYGGLVTLAAWAVAVAGSGLALKLGMVRVPGWARLLAAAPCSAVGCSPRSRSVLSVCAFHRRSPGTRCGRSVCWRARVSA